MPLICNDCENKTEFKEERWGQCSYSETVYLDENDEESDSENMEYDNYEDTDGDGKVCCKCDSSDIEEVDDEEWENWKGPVPSEKQPEESWKDYFKRKK